MHKHFTKLVIFVLCYSLFLLFPIVAHLINPNWPAELIPSIWVMTLWAVPVFFFVELTNVFNKVVCLIWMLWFLVGSTNVIASYLVYGNLYLIKVEFADFIYIAFTTVLFLSLLLAENLFGWGHASKTTKEDQRVVPHYGVLPLFAVFLFVFPFVWFLSIYLSVGYIPILGGIDIERDMYEMDFGPLYGFAAINVLTMLLLLDKWQSASARKTRYWYITLLVMVGFISAMTGKRMMVQIFVLGAFYYLVKVKGTRILKGSFLIMGGASVLFYVGILILRQGLNLDVFTAIELQLSVIGVEFRDFVYAINSFSSDDLNNYSWAASTLVSGLNSKILGMVGINKQEILEMGLGYVAKPLFMGGFFSVRTGLISELFLAYNFWGMVIICCFGLLVGWLDKTINQPASKTSLIFRSSIYGLLATSIVANSIDIVGTLTVWFYTWILYRGLQLFARVSLS